MQYFQAWVVGKIHRVNFDRSLSSKPSEISHYDKMQSMYTPNFLSLTLIISGLLITSNCFYAWANRDSTGFDHVFILSGNAIWLLALGLRLGTTSVEFYLDLNRLIIIAFCMMSLGIFNYTFSFAGNDYRLSRRNLLLVALIPMLGILLFFTNSAHHLMWTDIQLYSVSGMTLSKINYQICFYINIYYDLFLLVVSLFVFLRIYANLTELQRKQALILFFSVGSAVLATFIYIAGLNEYPYYNLVFSIPSLFVTWGVWRYRLLDVVGIPREQLIQEMQDAVLVVDRNLQVADANPAARRLAGLPQESAEHGKILIKLKPLQLSWLQHYDAAIETHQQLTLGTVEKPEYYDIRSTPLYDWRHNLTGRLLVLRNTTELYQREVELRGANTELESVNARLRAEIQFREKLQLQAIEQQRKLAVLAEREELGRELHDGLGQILGFLNMLAQVSVSLLENKELDKLRQKLVEISDVVRDGHDSVRSFILGLRPGNSQQNLPQKLAEMMAEFPARDGLQVILEYPENAPDPAFEPAVEYAQQQIIHEALTNVSKHANAQQVVVKFNFTAELAQIEVVDNGQGFDLESKLHALASPQGESGHFGLKMMRERAEKVGGRLDFYSEEHKGTRLVLNLPCLLRQIPLVDEDDLRLAFGRRILLADDHPLFLEGLAHLLRMRGLTVVGLAHNGLEAESMAQALRPDVVIMDVNMPGRNGLEATRNIKAMLPETTVIILTVSENESTLVEAIKNGASGYLLKSMDVNEFIRLLAGFTRGEVPLSPGMALRMLDSFSSSSSETNSSSSDTTKLAGLDSLSERQQMILERISQGKKYKEIGNELFLSERTVKREMGKVVEILQLQNRQAVKAFARKTLPGRESNPWVE